MFNVFWMIQSIVSLIPRLSPSTPETTVSGFALIVIVSMAKDAYEDYMRYRSDVAFNRAQVSVRRGETFVQARCALAFVNLRYSLPLTASATQIPSELVRVGDVLRVSDGEALPADLIVLATAEGAGGSCLLETSNLDGSATAQTQPRKRNREKRNRENAVAKTRENALAEQKRAPGRPPTRAFAITHGRS